ncbi:MAG: V-type ATP synthase subunit F [Candidatus Micrarchaeota archaeon]|nr:V-type ATP synthase subunit F [Candidatus Micrarchaeota archaeon]
MESRVGNKDFKMAVVGSRLLTTGSRLAGIKVVYEVTEPQEVEKAMHELMQKEDIGIIVITENLLKKIRDRKLLNAIDNSLLPLIIDIPDYNEPERETDTLRRLILRAVGIDINRMSK